MSNRISWLLVAVMSTSLVTSSKSYRCIVCGVTEIPKDDIPEDVTEVKIIWNEIPTIKTNDFAHLSVCRNLTLRSNDISTIQPRAFRGLSQVERLYLGSNLLTEVRVDMWEGLVSLKVLSLNFNKITRLEEGSFAGLGSLSRLDLFSNEITTISSGAFQGLAGLVELDLSYNQLTELRTNMFEGLPSLEELGVNMKRLLTSVQPGIMAELPALKTLGISTRAAMVFNKTSFITSPHDEPREIALGFDWSDLEEKTCDQRMCWIKEGEEDGWVKLVWNNGPKCLNYGGVRWQEVNLHCDQ